MSYSNLFTRRRSSICWIKITPWYLSRLTADKLLKDITAHETLMFKVVHFLRSEFETIWENATLTLGIAFLTSYLGVW